MLQIEKKTIKALVVDDSILFRETLAKYLSHGLIEVIGTAADPYEARDKILALHPDVVTLDVEMPKMNGIQFLRKLIPQYPIPVVVVSSLAINAFEALEAGAVDFIKKPTIRTPEDMSNFCSELRTKVVVASSVKVTNRKATTQAIEALKSQQVLTSLSNSSYDPETVIAIGASTGGTEALQKVLQKFPNDIPPVLIVQHMPAGFTKMFSERMNKVCQFDVKEAEDGDRLRPGLCIIGAGDYHLRVHKDSKGYYISSQKGDRVNGHCPSVDILFNSVAETVKDKAIGAILTGMGGDGAKGLLEMRKAGAYTIGQDSETSVVYGMPMVAFNIGAVCKQAPIDKIAEIIYNRLKN